MKKLLAILLVVVAFTLNAQDKAFTKDNFSDKKALKEALKEIEVADYLLGQGIAYYATALPHYLNAYKLNPNNAKLNYKIGQCYVLGTGEKSKAIKYFQKAKELDPFVKSDIDYMIALGHQKASNIDKAMELFIAYKKDFKPSFYVKNTEMVDKRIQECKMAKKLMKTPIRVFVDNMGPVVNSKYWEYGAIINADESQMLFTSRRPDSQGGKIDEAQNTYYEDIYMITNENGKWSAPKNMGDNVNSKEHDAVVGFSPDGTKLLIYKGDGDLYECKLRGDEWVKPKRLGYNINTEERQERSATYSPDGKTLYFTSNKYDDNEGGFDIFESQWEEKYEEWGPSKNLSTKVNTKYNEDGIFMHPDGKTLYFSSDGELSMGGYDIFRTVRQDDGTWSTPENIGYPVNSVDDDVFFSLTASGKRGYYMQFSEDGYGGRDLYEITFMGAEKPVAMSRKDQLLASGNLEAEEIEPVVKVNTSNVTILTGIIRDDKTKQPLVATVEIYDNQAQKVVTTLESNSATGKYLVTLPSGKNYGVSVSAKNYLFHSENFDIPKSAAYQKITKNIDLMSIEIGSKIILKNIFFDTAKSTLRDESNRELARLLEIMNDNPSIVIEISGHTDNRGSDAYNQKLSEDRAKVVVEYLTAKGVKAKRMVAKGYGEAQPIVPNDTKEHLQMNRRTEFKIIGK
jgi:outer membrane protein OmpA-like peptidoglycan-associated protein/tetratricopeptide (TPR) repeat protein